MRLSTLLRLTEDKLVDAARASKPRVSYAAKHTQHWTVCSLRKLADKLDTTPKLEGKAH